VKGAVYLVYSCWVAGGLKVFAVCSSRKAAEMARSRVAKGKKRDSASGRVWYYDAPLLDPYACELHIQKVRVDMLYPWGLEEKKLDDFEGNSEKTEVIV
jgi:hypothetical protein